MAKIAQAAGIKHASVISAQGANANIFAVDWIHPLLYVQSMGRKELTVTEKATFERVSIFRPGMLDRMKADRALEKIFLGLLGGLRVDALARGMLSDAEAGDPLDERAKEPVIYEGNHHIRSIHPVDFFKGKQQ